MVILIFTLFIRVTACSNQNIYLTEVLDITLEHDEIAIGQTTEITATAKDRNGNLVSIEPEWSIVSGAGSLSSEDNKATFSAVDMDYLGEVKIHGKVEDIIAEKTIEIIHLLKDGNDEKYLIEDLATDNYYSIHPIKQKHLSLLVKQLIFIALIELFMELSRDIL